VATRVLRSPSAPIALAVVIVAALWPVTAYGLSPLVLPVVVALAAAAVLIATRPEWGVALALALAPWTNLHVGGERPLRLVLPPLAFGLLIYGMLVASRERRAGAPAFQTAGIVLFAGVAIVSALQALDPAQTLTKLFGLLTAVALFFAVLTICHARGQLLLVAAGAVAGLLVASAQGALQHALGQFGEGGFVAGGEIVGRVQGSFGHPNQYAGFIAVLLPVAVGMLATRATPGRMRLLAGVALGFALPALTFAYARGAFLGLAVGAVVWLTLLRPRVAVGVAVVMAVGSVALAPAALKDRVSDPAGGDIGLRADLWGSALDIYTERPVLGVGINNFAEGYVTLPSTLANASQRRLLHQVQVLTPPHAANLYLNILAEQGLLGILAFAGLAFTSVLTVYRGSRIRDPAGRALCLGLGVGLMTLAVHSLFEVTLFSELSQPLFALLAVAGVFVSLDREESHQSP